MDKGWYYPDPATHPAVIWCPQGVEFHRVPRWRVAVVLTIILAVVAFNVAVVPLIFPGDDWPAVIGFAGVSIADGWVAGMLLARWMHGEWRDGIDWMRAQLEDEHSGLCQHMQACARQAHANIKSGLPPYHGPGPVPGCIAQQEEA